MALAFKTLQDAIAHGTQVRGEKLHTAKLNERAVRIIRKLRDLGYTYKRLGEIFAVTSNAIIQDCCLRKTWANVV